MKNVLALVCLAGALAGVLPVTSARAWWPAGHEKVTSVAVGLLPHEVPAFFRARGQQAAHGSWDPDLFKNRGLTTMTEGESPEHYIDMELIQGRPLPADRWGYYKLCAELNVEPKVVGTIPYALVEWTQKLAVAFAEHRKYPNNIYIQTKVLVYAGILAHYAGDCGMPLHTTIHHDGRALPDNSSPKTGIHFKVDALIEKCDFLPDELTRGNIVELNPDEDVWAVVLRQIENSHALVDHVYSLERELPSTGGLDKNVFTPAVREFTVERARTTANFLSRLYLWAWRRSATVELPNWLQREEDVQAAALRAATQPRPVETAAPLTTPTPAAAATTAPAAE